MEEQILAHLRAICLALPKATEGGGVGNPTFRVREKIFAMRHPHEGRWSLWCKAPRGLQEAVVYADPARFFVPPYVGRYGWIGIWLDDDLDWEHVADLIEDSYCMIAPKKLVKQLHPDNP